MTSLSINLPQGFIPKIKEGDKVVAGQAVAGKNIVGINHEINIFNVFNIDPSHAGKILVKKAGDRVRQGDAIAIKKGALGMGTKKAVSPVDGTVFNFDEISGVLTVRSSEESSSEDIFSPVDGEVELCDNEKIILRTQESVILATDAIGQGSLEGVLLLLKRETIDGVDIKTDVKGKIILGKTFTMEALAKSIALCAQAVIAEKIREEDLRDLGSRMSRTPIFVVAKDDFDKIQEANGKRVYLEPGRKIIIFLKK